jgi:hypothetical protein
MLESFKVEGDGSIIIRIQKDSPGSDWEPNWLPTPNGPFYMVMRLYIPEQIVIDGEWVAPPVRLKT